MTLSIRKDLPNTYKLVKDLKGDGRCKLHQNENSYICSVTVPWFDPNKVLYIEINATKECLEMRRRPPLGFEKNELF